MNLFAHNGVDHATAADAMAHSTPQVVLITVVVTIAAVLFMAAITYALHRFKLVKIPVKERED